MTLTHQKGWLAALPGRRDFNGTSSINWFGDFQDLANNAFIGVPPAGDPNQGELNFLCGGIAGAEAQFIVDLIGTSAPIDYGECSRGPGDRRVLSAPWTEG